MIVHLFAPHAGYQNSRGTPDGDVKNNAYNAQQRYKTVELGMIDPLKKSLHPNFQHIIRQHFHLRSMFVLAMVRDQWCVLNSKESGAYKNMNAQVTALKKQLDRLPGLLAAAAAAAANEK